MLNLYDFVDCVSDIEDLDVLVEALVVATEDGEVENIVDEVVDELG